MLPYSGKNRGIGAATHDSGRARVGGHGRGKYGPLYTISPRAPRRNGALPSARSRRSSASACRILRAATGAGGRTGEKTVPAITLAWQAAGWRTGGIDLGAETLVFQRTVDERASRETDPCRRFDIDELWPPIRGGSWPPGFTASRTASTIELRTSHRWAAGRSRRRSSRRRRFFDTNVLIRARFEAVPGHELDRRRMGKAAVWSGGVTHHPAGPCGNIWRSSRSLHPGGRGAAAPLDPGGIGRMAQAPESPDGERIGPIGTETAGCERRCRDDCPDGRDIGC